MFEENFVGFSASTNCVDLVGAHILVDSKDNAGIHIAAQKLAQDFGRVTEGVPNPVSKVDSKLDGFNSEAATAIILGSIESSRILRRLEKEGRLDFGKIYGKWESFTTAVISKPFGGFGNALVIAGSDKRGAIFGIYTLSEQIGVSPWYWWADVPPKHHSEIYALSKSTLEGEPSVRYRGLFLNDEAPALTGWVLEKYGKYNSEFYKNVFELLLRLKANFMWPAMWPGYPNPGASFFVDDLENQIMADEYGIMVSTSHHEPMQRLSNEWFINNPDGSWNWLTNKKKITEFFHKGAQRAKGYDSYFTLGMRGEYDKKMVADDPVAVVQDVIKTQREVIKDVYGSEDAVPQLLALYKEMQTLYESGRLEVPDDVTLLFQDDNHGTIRQLPTKKQAERNGGSGLYYHFEYVGKPRSYKWINSNSLGKSWHQLMLAYHHNVRQIWIFNVGDLKPQEVPFTFAMAMAWNVKSIGPDGLQNFYQQQAERDFGPVLAKEISVVWHKYHCLTSLRKHELIEPTTFSILHYNEAEVVLNSWKTLLDRAEAIHSRVTEEQKAASFELVLHPVKASYIFIALNIMLARNQLYARQRRNSANVLARRILDLFDADFDLSEEFHALLNGRWNHMLQQPHFGYEETWHAPSRDMIIGLGYVQRRQNSNAIVGQMGVAVEGHEGVRPGRINEESERTHPSRRDLVPGVKLGPMTRYGPEVRWFEIFTRGTPTIHWSASVPYDWMVLSASSGILIPGEDDARVKISIDWSQVSDTFNEEVLVDVRSEEGDFEQIHLPINGRQAPDSFKNGFVEGPGHISIPATSCIIEPPYVLLPDAGRLESGSVSLDISHPDESEFPYLGYPFYVFSETSTAALVLYFGMTLEVSPEDVMSYDIQFDNGAYNNHRLQRRSADSIKDGNDDGLPEAQGWFFAASDMVWVRRHEMQERYVKPGEHFVRIRLRHPNMMLEKLVVDLDGIHESYLGPPPSFKR